MKIIFSGGGTLGPVTPLLSIYETIKEKYKQTEFIWVGTKYGPEKQLVEKNGIQFVSFSSGKLRRYLSFGNFVDIFRVIIGFFESISFLKKEKPDLCVSAGGFVSVPLHLAAKLFGVPTWIHQQDIEVGLSNKIMSYFAKTITTSLDKNKNKFPAKKTTWIGNPVRNDILIGDKSTGLKRFNLSGNLPVLFVTGGGTGSETINDIMVEAVQHLKGVCEIVHLSGKERPDNNIKKIADQHSFYHTYKFFDKEMKDVYAVSDIVISRGGFGTLAELSALKKPSIIIPLPGQQEKNVNFLADSGAIIMLDQRVLSGVKLANIIKDILSDKNKMKKMSTEMNRLLPVAKKEEILKIFDLTVK
jgi:UDP-N-acetylglucosamine--N-acetylmuramyl-(pentapeptide) pyrophosphoryl-undecaprenol N-acetylglucosamine transferase